MIKVKMITIDVRMINASGIGVYIRNLLPRIIATSHDLPIYLLGNCNELNQYDWAANDHVEIINCDKPIFSIASQLEVIKKIPRDTKLFWSPNFIIRIFSKGKVLATVHDVFHLAMPEYLSMPVRASAKILIEVLQHTADKIICVSHFSARELIRLTRIPEEKIQVIYNGVDNSWFHVTPKGNPYDKPYLLFVGNVKPHKNLSALLKAFSMLKDKIDHDLVVVGKREGFLTPDNNLENAINNYNLHERVHFTGYIEDDLLKQYYVFADALVFTSLYEGFGLPPLEAMASGIPVITSNISSLPEIAGDAAILINPLSVDEIADALIRVIEDNELRLTLVAKGIERAKRFSWEDTAYKTLKLFSKVGL